MKKINFTKVVASGNDFVVVDNRKPKTDNRGYPGLSQKICNRKYGIGADGLLILDKSKLADIKMRVFNPDSSEAQMCGNGARCVSLWLKSKILKIETKAGIIESEVNKDNVKIKLTDPTDIKLDTPIKINPVRNTKVPDHRNKISNGVNNRSLKINFINTGVPHAVIFVEGLDKIDVLNLGREIRYHNRFSPRGTNVDFVEVISNNSIKVRTYERGVEDETLACGTGAVASALLYAIRYTLYVEQIKVHTKSGEILKVYFDKIENKFKNVWLEGKARIVYTGQIFI